MKLYEAIKELVAKSGVDIISTKQFVNILDDVGAFKEEPAASKKVMRGLLGDGFGEQLIHISERKEGNWQNSIRKSINDYAVRSGYKDELINGIASQMLYALGVVDEMPQGAVRQSLRENKHEATRIDDPKMLLYALKREYISALADLMTYTTDEFGYEYGYYSTDANTRLYVISSKIKLIAKEVGDSNADAWLIQERTKIESKSRPTTAQIEKALNDLMISLEAQYKAIMEKSVVVEDDEFGLKSATFSPQSTSDVSEIERKIIIIGNRRNEDRRDWITKTKKAFLASKSSPISARKSIVEQLKKEYGNRLSQLDKNIKAGEIDFSDSVLIELRHKLIYLGDIVGSDMDKWCNSENEKLIAERNARYVKIKRRNKIISIAASTVLFIGGYNGASYISSSDARTAYETTMSSADKELADGNYAVALELYQQAATDYNSYHSSKYKSNAHSQAAIASDRIVADWMDKVNPMLQSGQVTQAKALSLALPQNLVLDGTSAEIHKALTEQIDNEFSNKTKKIVDELLNDIYTHRGKLSDAGKKELEAMIAIMPDDYWLNMIMEKQK